MNKRLIGFLLLICVAITCIGIVCAEEVTIDDVKLNIPDGYTEVKDLANEIDDSYGHTTVKTYQKGDDCITINVIKFNDPGAYVPQDNEVEKTIKDKKGYYNPELKTFTYEEDNGKTQVVICITGDESILNEIVV